MIMKRINTTAKPEKINEVVAFAHNGNTEIVETLDFRDGVRYALEFVKETSAERDRLKEENKELLGALKELYFDRFAGSSPTIEYAMDHAPTVNNDFEQSIIKIIRKNYKP